MTTTDATTVPAIDQLVRQILSEARALGDSPAGRDPLELLTVDQVVQLFQVKKAWVYDTVEQQHLPCVRVGRSLRFRRADLERYLDERGSSS